MSQIQQYLDQYFLQLPQFARHCATSEKELRHLLDAALIPAASYVVTEAQQICSAVFGCIEAPGTIPGNYFHPANKVWVELAVQLLKKMNLSDAASQLRLQFTQNFATSLQKLDQEIWRLQDSFDDRGNPLQEGLNQRCDFIWEHFLLGTCGLCVANPISESAIARKEILQEKLT
ncbi:MAG: hypothetical protein K2P84_06750, partial [Undibacterium sp.]|nr:hypothetical protein [Undibacterium sp.]